MPHEKRWDRFLCVSADSSSLLGSHPWPESVKTLSSKQVGYRATRLHHLGLWGAFTELIHLPSAKEMRNNNKNGQTAELQAFYHLGLRRAAFRRINLPSIRHKNKSKTKTTTELGVTARFHRITLPSICQRNEKKQQQQQQNRQTQELQAFATWIYGALSQSYSTFHLPKKREKKTKNNNNQTAELQAITTWVYGPLSQN